MPYQSIKHARKRGWKLFELDGHRLSLDQINRIARCYHKNKKREASGEIDSAMAVCIAAQKKRLGIGDDGIGQMPDWEEVRMLREERLAAAERAGRQKKYTKPERYTLKGEINAYINELLDMHPDDVLEMFERGEIPKNIYRKYREELQELRRLKAAPPLSKEEEEAIEESFLPRRPAYHVPIQEKEKTRRNHFLRAWLRYYFFAL